MKKEDLSSGEIKNVLEINKFLEPISGVLETVLTSGGDEVLD